MKCYLKTNGGLVVGETEVTRSTPVLRTFYNSDTEVEIIPLGRLFLYKGLITGLTDENDDAYTDRAALEAATADFFFRVGGSGGNSKISTYTGDDATTNFAVPGDFVSALFVLNPYSVPFTIITIGSLKYVHFTEAPVTGDFPQLVYVS